MTLEVYEQTGRRFLESKDLCKDNIITDFADGIFNIFNAHFIHRMVALTHNSPASSNLGFFIYYKSF